MVLLWTKLNPIHPRMLCAKFGWIWLSGQCIFAISNYLPLEKVGALHLNKVESPSLKDSLCKVWLKLALWFWRRRFLKFSQFIFAISQLSPLGKGQGPSFEQNWIPFTQGCFVQSLVDIGLVVQEKKIFKFRQCIFAIS